MNENNNEVIDVTPVNVTSEQASNAGQTPPSEQAQQAQQAQPQQQQQPDSHYPPNYTPQSTGTNRSAGSSLLVIMGVALILVGTFTLLPSLLGTLWAPIAAMIAFAARLLWPAVLIAAGVFIIYLATSPKKRESETSMGFSPSMPPEGTRLMRSSKDRMVAGICGGIANYFSIDPTIVRIITLVLFFLPGVSWIIYLIAWVIIPLDRNN
ncbi:MAG: PspC domain-containing protein [Coriobacteriia bacterium]|nr:PspC domain-containing protein [Coriobacteriia bacterium]